MHLNEAALSNYFGEGGPRECKPLGVYKGAGWGRLESKWERLKRKALEERAQDLRHLSVTYGKKGPDTSPGTERGRIPRLIWKMSRSFSPECPLELRNILVLGFGGPHPIVLKGFVPRSTLWDHIWGDPT